jgi:hypothetical protein
MVPNGSDGVELAELAQLSVGLLQQTQQQFPRTGPGAKPTCPDWLIALIIVMAVMKQKTSKSAQWRFVNQPPQRALLASVAGTELFPPRSTFLRRYQTAHRLLQHAIAVQGQRAIDEGLVDATHTAVDKSLIAAAGPVWHTYDQRAGKQPRGVDVEAAWGKSEYHGWVYGYSYEVVVSATPDRVVFPLLASVDVASAAEPKTFATKIPQLPESTQTVSADKAYDANALGEAIEYDAKGRRTGRRFLCPENPRNHGRPKTKPGGADQARAKSRQRRGQRQKFLASARGRKLYRRRSQTVEPFNSWLKSSFGLIEQVWHRGLANNRTQILAAIFSYQLLVRFNHRCGRNNGKIQWILEAL